MATGALTTGKVVEYLFENSKETYEKQEMMLDLTDFSEPDGGMMQNSGNVIWKPVQQHRPIITGWDLTGLETGVIEESYPAVLGEPNNDFISQRIDNMRDRRFWERAGRESGKQQATELNKDIATAAYQQGSLFYRSDVSSGYDFIAEAQAMQNERQLNNMGRCFVLNDRTNLKFGKDLAARQTLQGKPDETWRTGQIGQNIAEYDLYAASFLPNIIGGADPATTVTGDQSFAPESGSVDPTTKAVTNIDYREAIIVVAASGSYNVGDKVTISNSETPVQAIGLADKNPTGQAMTFTIISKPDSTHLKIFPKPIALDDAGLTTLEKAYANIDTQILDTATVDRLNIDATAKVNLFWDKDAIEVIGGTIPGDLFSSLAGQKSYSDTMKNGVKMYIIWDGDIKDLTFRYRLFIWYGITVRDPANVGVALAYS